MTRNTTPAPWPIVDRKIRFALAGCGRISKNHFQAMAKHAERAELVAVCDTDFAALAAAEAAGLPVGAGPRSIVIRAADGSPLALGELRRAAEEGTPLLACPNVVFPWAVREGRA